MVNVPETGCRRVLPLRAADLGWREALPRLRAGPTSTPTSRSGTPHVQFVPRKSAAHLQAPPASRVLKSTCSEGLGGSGRVGRLGRWLDCSVSGARRWVAGPVGRSGGLGVEGGDAEEVVDRGGDAEPGPIALS